MNSALFDAINELAGHSAILDDLAKVAARYLVMAMAAAVAMQWVTVRHPKRARNQAMVAGALVAVVAGLAATSLIQHFYVHPRPFMERQDVVLLTSHSPDASLPSEHVIAAFALAGAVLWSRRLVLGSGLLLAAVVVGLARIYTGLHYPADIGAAVALALPLSFMSASLVQPIVLRLRGAVAVALPIPLRTLLFLD
jgi:undecaprenyl-diphosphatase